MVDDLYSPENLELFQIINKKHYYITTNYISTYGNRTDLVRKRYIHITQCQGLYRFGYPSQQILFFHYTDRFLKLHKFFSDFLSLPYSENKYSLASRNFLIIIWFIIEHLSFFICVPLLKFALSEIKKKNDLPVSNKINYCDFMLSYFHKGKHFNNSITLNIWYDVRFD